MCCAPGTVFVCMLLFLLSTWLTIVKLTYDSRYPTHDHPIFFDICKTKLFNAFFSY